MPRHAAVTHLALLLRSEAVPLRRRDRHSVRSSGGGRASGDRRPGKCGDAPAPRPAPLQRILVGLRVLVVDDDPDALELFAAALTTCGADVTTSDNARDAVALATRM